MKKVTKIELHARRWFQRTHGNTYHSVNIDIVFGDKTHEFYRIPYEYGYGRQFEQTAYDYLIEYGFLPSQERYNNGGRKGLSVYCDDNDIDFASVVVGVPRKKDL